MVVAASRSSSYSTHAPLLLHQLESMMNSKDLENRALRRRIQILESVMRQHGIHNVTAVNDKDSSFLDNTDTQTETESVSSYSHASYTRPRNAKDKLKDVVQKVAPAVQDKEYTTEDDDDDDDDDSQKTETTANTFYTKRSLIMPPPELQTPEPEPHPMGTKPGGRWYKQTKEAQQDPEAWKNPFNCSCSPKDVKQEGIYIYYDRKGSRKYFLPTGKQVPCPINKRGTVLSLVPNDGTMRRYFENMDLPLYHQKKHVRMTNLRFVEPPTSSKPKHVSYASPKVELQLYGL